MIAKRHKIFDADLKTEDKTREVDFGDIAILHRSRGPYLDVVLAEIEKFGIPVQKLSQEEIVDEFEVQILVNYLKLLDNFFDDFALAGFLSSPVVNLSFAELSLLAECGNFCDAVLTSENKKVQFALNLIEEGKNKLLNDTIFNVLNWFVEKTNLKSFLLALPQGKKKVLNVEVFVNDFLNYSYNNNLTDYISFLEENSNHKFEPKASGEKNSVSVVTMHHSKGLEFPIVFAVDMAHQFNRSDQRGPCLLSQNLGVGVQKVDKENRIQTNTIARSAIVIETKQKQLAEELRVLYVGLTRAKNHLFVLGKADLNKLCENTSPVALLGQSSFMSLLLCAFDQKDLNSLMLGNEHLKISSNKQEKTFFEVNVFTKSLKCEFKTQKIQESNILKAETKIFENWKNNQKIFEEQAKKSFVALKNSVSRIMEKEDMRETASSFVKKFEIKENETSASEIGTAFHLAMEKLDFSLETESEVKEFLEKQLDPQTFKLIDCKKIFNCLKFLKPILKDSTKVLREQKFYLKVPHKTFVLEGCEENILIQGIIDLVVVKNGEAILIDFKTNREKDDEKMKEKYKIQLDCYQIAVENALKTRVSSKILYSFFKEYAIFV